MTEASSPTKHSSTNGVDYHKEDHHEENCPDIELPDDSDDTCVLGDHCSKVTCASPPDSTGPFSHMVLTVQAYGCRQPVKATVTMESSQSTSVKWSHKFKDGEKAALPMKPPEAADDIKIFLKVELKKNGGKVHFKVQNNKSHCTELCLFKAAFSLFIHQVPPVVSNFESFANISWWGVILGYIFVGQN